MSESILQRIAGGDHRAVKECLDRYANLVWSVARRMSPNPADAEDAVQEIFVELWKSADRFDPDRASEPAFVTMIARRRLIDRLRLSNRRPQTTPIPEDLDFAGDQHERVELGAEASLAMRALEILEPAQRRAVVLSVVHGMSHREVAEHTQLPLGTVKSHIRRGLNAVRESLAAANRGEEASS